jgi:hypothetical protein
MVTKTETIKTSSGTFECEVIKLDSMLEVDKDKVGERLTDDDYERLVDNNAVIYVGGKRVAVFLKEAITEMKKFVPGSTSYEYWKWVSKDLLSDARGLVGGREMTGDTSTRLTKGQEMFFRAAKKGQVSTIEEAKELVSKHSGHGRYCYYVKKMMDSGYLNSGRIEELESILRKRSYPADQRELALQERNNLRQEWFENWLKDWEQAEDKPKFAADSYKKFVSIQTRANSIYSNILGMFDRSARNPYGRMSATTARNTKQFEAHKGFYRQVSDLYKSVLPTEWKFINNVMSQAKDERYNLFGTVFSTITINYNFETFAHFDGNNCEGGVAVLTAMTNESYPGEKYGGANFVMPALGLAFNIRHSDFLIADNQSIMHGETARIDKCDDLDRIIFVFYSRAGVVKLDKYEDECCRKDFVKWASENCLHHSKNNDTKFTGVWPGAWVSPEWNEYKAKHCPEASNTNCYYSEC